MRDIYFSTKYCNECEDHPCCGLCDKCTPTGCLYEGFFDELVVNEFLKFDASFYYTICRSFPLCVKQVEGGSCKALNNTELLESLKELLTACSGEIELITNEFVLIANE